ncbi:MAG: hypothetical protein ACREEP_18560 [Dongiaceae bacterium]
MLTGPAAAEDALREVYFHDLAKNRIGNVIIAQTNPETEILVFSGGELALEGDNLVIIARHARIDGDTIIRSFRQPARAALPGEPHQAAGGANGANKGDPGGNGAAGASGIAGNNGASAGKVVLRIGEVTGRGRLIVDLYGQGGGKGQNGGQGGDGGKGRDGKARVCGGADPQDGGDGGWGGIGGQGGAGGRGGNGGIVVYSKALAALIASGRFQAEATTGKAGVGGDPGEAGNPGSGGVGGAGVLGCGAGGNDGAPGGRTSGAQPGPAGLPGSAGTAIEEETQ